MSCPFFLSVKGGCISAQGAARFKPCNFRHFSTVLPLVHRHYGYLGTIHIFRGRFFWCHTTILSILISLPYKTKRLYGQIAQNPADCGTSREKIRPRNQNLYPGGSAEKITTAIFRKICFIPYNFSRLSIFPAFSIFRPFSLSGMPRHRRYFLQFTTLRHQNCIKSPFALLPPPDYTVGRRHFKTGRVCHGTDDAF